MEKLFYTSKAREIGVKNRSVSGVVPDVGAYESTLERDFMELTRFDPFVDRVIPQPLSIYYEDSSGIERKYTPDGLLLYKEFLRMSPILYEVKHRYDSGNSWRELLPKFRAAKKTAWSRAWEFKVFTEVDIRTPYLDNVKFLWSYKNQKVDEAMIDHVLMTLSDLEEADPELLLFALCRTNWNRAMMIPVVWHLIANIRIGCDLDKPLNMRSKIWTKEDL